MKRTTIVAEEETLERLRGLARDRGVSFAEVVREALEAKAAEFRRKPRSLGMFSGPPTDAAVIATEPVPPVSWRSS